MLFTTGKVLIKEVFSHQSRTIENRLVFKYPENKLFFPSKIQRLTELQIALYVSMACCEGRRCQHIFKMLNQGKIVNLSEMLAIVKVGRMFT